MTIEFDIYNDNLTWRNGYKYYGKTAYHRLVYETRYKIPANWHIHHIDCNKENNNIDNLIAIPASVHLLIHDRMRDSKRIFNRAEVEQYLKQYQDDLIIYNKYQSICRTFELKWKFENKQNQIVYIKTKKKKRKRYY